MPSSGAWSPISVGSCSFPICLPSVTRVASTVVGLEDHISVPLCRKVLPVMPGMTTMRSLSAIFTYRCLAENLSGVPEFGFLLRETFT
jgi:hypothetical protein